MQAHIRLHSLSHVH